MLIFCILISALLQFGALVGIVTLWNMLVGLIRMGMFDNDDARTVCCLLITIAICLVAAVHVMPA
jgi:hypothetical protein